MLDQKLLEILACPYCKSSVVQKNDKIVCDSCSRSYPVKDGIPVMLIDEAEIMGNKK
ncbi:MAG: Trm112 family protein [Candidatus Omnitrophota bacterium]